MHAKHTKLKTLILFLAVALLLTAPAHAQTLKADQSKITIGQVLGCNDSQLVNLTSSTSGAITFTATLTYAPTDLKGPGWLFARDTSNGHQTSGVTAPITLTVPANGTVGLLVGLNYEANASDSATLTLTSTSPAGQTITIPVTFLPTWQCTPLTVNNGVLTAVPPNLYFTQAQGTGGTQDTIIANISANPVTFIAESNPFVPWISLGLTVVTLQPGQQIAVPVTVNATGLAVGTYTAQFGITSLNIPELFITVNLTVVSNGVGPTTTNGVKATPSALNFTFVPEGHQIGQQTLNITNQAGNAAVPIAVSVTQFNGPANWLQTNYQPGAVTPFTLSVSPNNLGFVPGVTYQGTITITPYVGPAVVVYVSVAVTAAPQVSATPNSLTFNYTQGGTTPPAQTVVVTGSGNVVSYSTVAIIPGWLSAFPATGSAPNGSLPYGVAPGGGTYMYVNVNPAGLAVGKYTGTVTVYGNGPAVGQTNIQVTLNVSGAAIKSVASAASYTSGPVAPGEMVTLFTDLDSAFGPTEGVSLTGDMIVDNKLPTSMGGVEVLFNGVPAPLIFVSATQINAVVPYELEGMENPQVLVKYNGQSTMPVNLRVAAAQPAIFTATSNGLGQAAVGQFDVKGTYLGMNSIDNPVTRGNVITMYVTGEGRTSSPVTGRITSAQAAAPYTPQPMLTPAVLIDGQPATVVFYGEVPGVVSGMMQVNVIVPKSARAGQVPVSITMGTNYSQAGVTIVAQ